ncbi:hypothetical protein BJ684DRAFT_19052 [Piptocephalis cylindrospora]|uniref:Cytochrome c oxidase assembly protein COX20, mitochondrial n=1 Tax=Piptocephalis cylindrospora TaxID=1907219 RepID=A0A4V1IYH3_9FUNG|nr:hypothetical protein BJ684DRAFT_19052 [Piptocephalis cylindrospora]|eukprot:RKP14559.1 hypothetical protein BJ684DRAFT_19052 [Piptocephalis cylindrospora]
MTDAVERDPQQPSSSIWDRLQATRMEDFQRVTRLSCGRKAFLTGLATGTGVGMIHFLVHRKIPRACNWAIGTFCAISVGVWEVCRYQEARKSRQMMDIVVKMNQLEAKRAKALASEISAVEREEIEGKE